MKENNVFNGFHIYNREFIVRAICRNMPGISNTYADEMADAIYEAAAAIKSGEIPVPHGNGMPNLVVIHSTLNDGLKTIMFVLGVDDDGIFLLSLPEFVGEL